MSDRFYPHILPQVFASIKRICGGTGRVASMMMKAVPTGFGGAKLNDPSCWLWPRLWVGAGRAAALFFLALNVASAQTAPKTSEFIETRQSAVPTVALS